MVEMGADVEVRAAASLVDLGNVVASHGEFAGIQVLEVLGGTKFAGVSEGVATDVIVLDKLLLQFIRQLDEGGAGVGKLGVTAGTLGGKLDGAEEGEAGSTEVIARIGMPKLVALEKVSVLYEGSLRSGNHPPQVQSESTYSVSVGTSALGIEERAVVGDVPSIEKLKVLVS